MSLSHEAQLSATLPYQFSHPSLFCLGATFSAAAAAFPFDRIAARSDKCFLQEVHASRPGCVIRSLTRGDTLHFCLLPHLPTSTLDSLLHIFSLALIRGRLPAAVFFFSPFVFASVFLRLSTGEIIITGQFFKPHHAPLSSPLLLCFAGNSFSLPPHYFPFFHNIHRTTNYHSASADFFPGKRQTKTRAASLEAEDGVNVMEINSAGAGSCLMARGSQKRTLGDSIPACVLGVQGERSDLCVCVCVQVHTCLPC